MEFLVFVGANISPTRLLFGEPYKIDDDFWGKFVGIKLANDGDFILSFHLGNTKNEIGLFLKDINKIEAL